MSSVRTFAQERARNQGLALEFDCPPDIGAIVADERRLKQALFNLVSNALKFTPPGGAVTLAARREQGGGVALGVSDTGVGVAREDQARIFEKFERGNPQAARRGRGSACRWSRASSSCMAAVSSCNRRPAPAPPSPSTSRPPPRRCARRGSSSQLRHAAGGRIFEMQRLAGIGRRHRGDILTACFGRSLVTCRPAAGFASMRPFLPA